MQDTTNKGYHIVKAAYSDIATRETFKSKVVMPLFSLKPEEIEKEIALMVREYNLIPVYYAAKR